ncbi:MAG: glycerol-3-phosphate dehydrogenase/oxidase [Desulfobacteraceae bacterium]|nr:MAG: glycerol-3-phosphate dehydrogenase/oxidase [Desulfobacteraceae bacterium]
MSNNSNPYWDIIIIGGGITGAGIFSRAARMGYRTLLVEARDYASGTSGKSSKMVHGGLRYLSQGRFLLTRAAVRERQRLLNRYPGLVTPLDFFMPVYRNRGPSLSTMKLGLSIYSMMAGKKGYDQFTTADCSAMAPGIRKPGLQSGLGFQDAQVDDARLVLRLIQKGRHLGACSMNYSKVTGVEKGRKQFSVFTLDACTGRCSENHARVVINATGTHVNELMPVGGKKNRIRPLRGSHLVFPSGLLPLDRVISFIHPRDHRPVFIFPWQGASVLGTTDVDHISDLDTEPRASLDEATYLMEGLHHILPESGIRLKDCIASFSGIRPVLGRGNRQASCESRDHAIWNHGGMITVTGGKLTTFDLLARDTLSLAKPYLAAAPPGQEPCPPSPKPEPSGLDPQVLHRAWGRYGTRTQALISQIRITGPQTIPGTHTLWAELAYAARHEQVRTLSDLLLRRVRIGLLLPNGGAGLLDKIESVCQNSLPWDQQRWAFEKKQYLDVWQSSFAPPPESFTPVIRKTCHDG